MSVRFWMMGVVLALVACGGGKDDDKAKSTSCGDLSCAAGEFCLVTEVGADQTYSCETLPDGCEDFDHMCFDDPPCVEYWDDLFCSEASTGSGCISFGSQQQASCYE